MKNFFLRRLEHYAVLFTALQTPKSHAKWQRTRAMGRKRFVWLIGVGLWGGLMFLFCTPALFYSMSKFPPRSQNHLIHPSLSELGAILLSCLAGGYLWGAGTWRLSERMYR